MPLHPSDTLTNMYVVTLRGTDKCYIGITTQKPRSRWNGHKNDARSGGQTHFQRALRKYGFDAFDWEVVGQDLVLSMGPVTEHSEVADG